MRDRALLAVDACGERDNAGIVAYPIVAQTQNAIVRSLRLDTLWSGSNSKPCRRAQRGTLRSCKGPLVAAGSTDRCNARQLVAFGNDLTEPRSVYRRAIEHSASRSTFQME